MASFWNEMKSDNFKADGMAQDTYKSIALTLKCICLRGDEAATWYILALGSR